MMKDFVRQFEALFYEGITGYMYSIQAPASLKILYILLHFYHLFFFFQVWVSTLLDLVLVDKIIIFTHKAI